MPAQIPPPWYRCPIAIHPPARIMGRRDKASTATCKAVPWQHDAHARLDRSPGIRATEDRIGFVYTWIYTEF